MCSCDYFSNCSPFIKTPTQTFSKSSTKWKCLNNLLLKLSYSKCFLRFEIEDLVAYQTGLSGFIFNTSLPSFVSSKSMKPQDQISYQFVMTWENVLHFLVFRHSNVFMKISKDTNQAETKEKMVAVKGKR